MRLLPACLITVVVAGSGCARALREPPALENLGAPAAPATPSALGMAISVVAATETTRVFFLNIGWSLSV